MLIFEEITLSTMKRIFPVIVLWTLSMAVSAQQALGPGSGLVSPEINPDHSVTFRYHNPKSKPVRPMSSRVVEDEE